MRSSIQPTLWTPASLAWSSGPGLGSPGRLGRGLMNDGSGIFGSYIAYCFGVEKRGG